MDEEKQSFIPKTSLAKLPFQRRGFGWFLGLSVFLLVASLLVSGGMFLYEGVVSGQIDASRKTLQKVEGEFELPLLRELRGTSQKIDSAKNLIKKHTALSRFFGFVEENTLFNVRFLSFSYNGEEISMSGLAQSYTALAQQAKTFNESGFIKNLSLSEISLQSGGFVSFRFDINIDEALISFQAQDI